MTPLEIFQSIAINFFTGCAQQIASQLDAKAAATAVDSEKWHRRSKALHTRIIESFSTAARQLVSVPRKLEPDRFAAKLTERDPMIDTPVAVRGLAVAMIEAFNAVIASDIELATLLGLRRSEALMRDVRNVSGEVAEVKRGVLDLQVRTATNEQIVDVTREIRAVGAAVAEGFHRLGAGPLPLESPVAERLAESTKRRFEKALNELKTGSVAVAAREFRDLLSDLIGDGPEEKNLLFRTTANLGIALYYLGETRAAEEQFDRALELDPNSIRAKANKVLVCLSRGDYTAAAQFLADALKSDPMDLDLIKFKAQLLADQGDIPAAVQFLEQHQIDHEDYFVSLAIYYNQAGEHSEAAEAAHKAIELNSNSEGGMAVLADALAMPIVFRKAEEKLPMFALSSTESEALRRAVELDERALAILRRSERKVAIAQLLVNFSAYCTAVGDFTRGASAAREAALMLPGHAAPLTNLYMAQMHLEEFSEAAKTARALAEIEPPEIATMREMDALMAQQEFPAVIKLYTTRISAIPRLQDEPHAVSLYAAALFRSFETDAAIDQLHNASRRFPNHPLLLLEQAHMREDLQELDRAEGLYTSAAKHAVGAYRFHAKQQLGLFYYRRENWAEAEKHLLGG